MNMHEILRPIYDNFYTTQRCAINMQSDGGGPFGFDIHFAIEVDYLIKMYNCDAIFETGTNAGDTTEYLSKLYPDKQIITSEVNQEIFEAAQYRLSHRSNVILNNESSEIVLKKYKDKFSMPFYYLDAHWYDYWPLQDELNYIDRGVVCISDFKLGINKHGIPYEGDTYNGVDLNHEFLLKCGIKETIYNNNYNEIEKYPLPCLQVGRRTGRAYFCKSVPDTHLENNKLFFTKNGEYNDRRN
jgi:hypothetical protein